MKPLGNRIPILQVSVVVGGWFRALVHTLTLHHQNQVKVIHQAGEEDKKASLGGITEETLVLVVPVISQDLGSP